MNNKSSRKAKLSLVLIVVFTVALLALIGLATWRNSAATSLEKSVKDLGQQNRAINLADNSIEKFFKVENAFRLYAATGQEQYKLEYIKGLTQLKEMLAQLERSIGDSKDEAASLQDLLRKKAAATNMFLRLKSVHDSLIQETAKLKEVKPIISPIFKALGPQDAKVFIERTTTVEEQKSSRKLIGRLKDAIANKAPGPVTTVTTTSKIQNDSNVRSDLTLKALNDLLKLSIDKLTFNHKLLSENERKLIVSNERLLNRLSSILKELKHFQADVKSRRDQELNRDARVSLQELSDITWIILFIGVALALIILLNAWQLYKHDKSLVAARNEALRQTHVRSDFLSHMSHEIRTPLNSILGFSEQLENSPLNDVQKEQIAAIRGSSRILLSIVNDVLDLSKFETGNVNLHTTNFYPEKTINHVVSSLQVLAAKKNLSLICHCEMGSEFRLAGDEYRLKQVLINLINNAIKFTESGSVTVRARVKDNNLIVEVSDTGRGIAKENLVNIFNEFTQITRANDKERHNGTGLGLAICKKIVEAQGGKIEVKSEIGKGSVFHVLIPYLPFQPELDKDVKKQIKPALDTSSFATKVVLVAEDDKMNIRLISTILKKWGMSFDVVESGKLAFESFERTWYDMILTDIHMPDGDGISLTKLIREYPDETKSKVPILAITANAMQKDLEEYRSIGMNDHIVKPFTEEKLYEKIKKNMRD